MWTGEPVTPATRDLWCWGTGQWDGLGVDLVTLLVISYRSNSMIGIPEGRQGCSQAGKSKNKTKGRKAEIPLPSTARPEPQSCAAAGSFLIMVALLSLNVYAAEVLAQLQLIIYFFSVVLENSLLTDFSDLQVDRLFLARCWLVGGGYFLACAAAGWLLFRGRDIS